MVNRINRLKKLTFTVVILSVALALGAAPLSCSRGGYSGIAESVTTGMEPNAVNALIYIAANQNYFAANGLNVTIRDYPSGSAAVNGILNNEVDVAMAAEFVIVGKAFEKANILTFGTIDKFMHIYVVSRKDRGIAVISDLKGKKVGVSLKTAAEFYFGRLLELNGMTTAQVNLVNLSPRQTVDALLNGDVDAVISWQPYIKTIEDGLGSRMVKWSAQSGQLAYDIIISSSAWAKNHPELVNRFLKSLVQAEDFSLNHPDESWNIVQKRLNYDDAYMEAILPQYQLTVSLDQSLITAMEDEARWMIKNNLTNEKIIPNFLDYIYEGSLKSVKPGAVNIIR